MSAGHTPRCSEYRRAYRERNRSLTARVCCCAESPETEPPPAETLWKVTMRDMPCVWCLLLIEGRPYQDTTVCAYDRHNPDARPLPVTSWEAAQDAYYGAGLVLRDHNDTRCELMSLTLINGDAVCMGHAVSVMRSRITG